MGHFKVCVWLAILASCCVAPSYAANVEVLARGCQMCRFLGSVKLCTTVNQYWTLCGGLALDSEAACIQKRGLYKDPYCYMV